MNHNLPPAPIDMSHTPDQQSPLDMAAQFPGSYGNVQAPHSYAVMSQMRDVRDGIVRPPEHYYAQGDYVPPTTRRSYAQIEVADQIAGTVPQVARTDTVANAWDIRPSAQRAQAEKLTKKDLMDFGGVVVRAAFKGVKVAGSNVIRPGKDTLKEAQKYGVSGAAQMHALRSGLKGAEAYEAEITTNPKAAKVWRRIEADMASVEADIRRRNIEASGGNPDDYDLVA